MTKNRKTGVPALDDYAGIMVEFREWCEERGMNFRGLVAGFALLLMGESPAAPAREDVPAAPEPAGGGVLKLLKAIAAPARAARESVPVVRSPNADGGNRGKWLVCDQFPGELLKARDFKRRAGLPETYNHRMSVRTGHLVKGKYAIRYATKQEVDAALGAAPAASKPSPRRKGDRP